jgi:4-alpha-glucanotransferase
VNLRRCAGILLHPTSLPSPYGIGDFGDEAYRFAGLLADAGQTIWQMLPLGPTGYGDSPYQLFSAFAGNPLLISPDRLARDGMLSQRDLDDTPPFSHNLVEFEGVIGWKTSLLTKAFRNFKNSATPQLRTEFDCFAKEHAEWLDDYALFIALKRFNGIEHIWTDWDHDLVTRKPEALAKAKEKLADAIDCQKYWQFEFHRQWNSLRAYCAARDLKVMGDIPIYVAHDSADVWAKPDAFQLDERGRPLVVAGVPPDYFSATGQLWGNPIYRWTEMAEDGYSWWVGRFRRTFRQFDLVRLDHFRGFQAYWEVPGGESTAQNGRWVPGPGADLFRALKKQLGDLEIVAENLGVITPEVEAIRHEFRFPGMAILQFAFGKDPQGASFRPHNYDKDLFAYTGTHDNDTVQGWWQSEGGDSTRTLEDVRAEKAFARQYLGTDGKEMHWTLIRSLMASVARAAVVPIQDLLGLGADARMNKPGTAGGNWRWRMRAGAFNSEIVSRLKEYAETYDRAPR